MYNLDRVFDDLADMFYGKGGYRNFPLDLVEVPNGYVVTAELPGVNKEDVKIAFADGILTIEASRTKDPKAKYLINERDVMNLKRSISFGEIDEESISAKLENGLLIVTIRTKAPEEKQKKLITIE